MVPSVLSGASLADVQLANMRDARPAVDLFELRPRHDTGRELTGFDVIRLKYPGPEGERWARYWRDMPKGAL